MHKWMTQKYGDRSAPDALSAKLPGGTAQMFKIVGMQIGIKVNRFRLP